MPKQVNACHAAGHTEVTAWLLHGLQVRKPLFLWIFQSFGPGFQGSNAMLQGAVDKRAEIAFWACALAQNWG